MNTAMMMVLSAKIMAQRRMQMTNTACVEWSWLAESTTLSILMMNAAKGMRGKSRARHLSMVGVQEGLQCEANKLTRNFIRVCCLAASRSNVPCFMCQINAPRTNSINNFDYSCGMVRWGWDSRNKITQITFCMRSFESQFSCATYALGSYFLKTVLFSLVRLVTKQNITKLPMVEFRTRIQTMNQRQIAQAWRSIRPNSITNQINLTYFLRVRTYLAANVRILSTIQKANISPQSLRVDCPRKEWYKQEMSQSSRGCTNTKAKAVINPETRVLWEGLYFVTNYNMILTIPAMMSIGMQTMVFKVVQIAIKPQSQKQDQTLKGMRRHYFKNEWREEFSFYQDYITPLDFYMSKVTSFA